MTKRLIVLVIVAFATVSVAGCSIKSDSKKKDTGSNAGKPTAPATTTPASTTPPPTTTTPPADMGAGTTTGGDTGGSSPVNPGTGRPEDTDYQDIALTIQRWFDGARKGNATEFCGQLSNAYLDKNFGGLQQCLNSNSANSTDDKIPPGRDLDFTQSITLNGDKATAEPTTVSGSTKYTIEMVWEGSDGGWSIDSLSNNNG